MDGRQAGRFTLDQGQYQNWHEAFSSNGKNGGQGLGDPAQGWLNIRQDVAHLQATGAIASYDLTRGVDPTLLNAWGAAITDPGWNAPLATNGVTQYMPGTGGRADIGFTTQSNTGWLMTQDARAAAHALGQAETASAIPWHLRDVANNTWLNTDAYPTLWTDGRGGVGRPGDATSGGLTQPLDASSGWTLDAAHQPDLSFVPYLLTGQRWMLDNLQAQASWSIMSQWPQLRDGAGDLVVQGNQVRGAAWSLRQIDEAAWASPEGSREKAYFTEASAQNWAWLVKQIPVWTQQQGEAHGWLPGEYGIKGAMPPWQQDYFASTVIAAASRGNADAMTFLKWQENFLVGRFTHAAQGFDTHDGAAYLIATGDATTGALYTSWAQMGAAMDARGWSNNAGWSQSQGDYAQLALATLAGIARVTGSAEAARVYAQLIADAAPFTSSADFLRDPTYAIAAPTVTTASAITKATTTDPAAPAMLDLVIVLGAESWQGDPQAEVRVDGVQVWAGTVSAPHATGGAAISLGQVTAGMAHAVTVSFLNDGWGGSASTDRNLHVEDVRLGGISTGLKAALLVNGDATLALPMNPPPASMTAPATTTPPPVIPGGLDLAIVLGAEAWQGDPQAVVRVDGVQVWAGTVTAAHATGGAAIALGQVTPGVAHAVTVSFLNDAWGGSASTDRNLYVEDVRLGGVSTGLKAALLSNGDATLNLPATVTAPAPTSISTPVSAPAATAALDLAIVLGGDSWQGDPQAVVKVDGVQAWAGTVTAAHATGGASIALGQVAAGVGHAVTVSFLNDGWGGSASMDRNLYVEDIRLGGASTGLKSALMSNGDVTLTLAAVATGKLLNGTGGADLLTGGLGHDTLAGGAGNDTLNGGAGQDRLTGGRGKDVFAFTSAAEANGDVITDFSRTQGDRLDLRPIDADTTHAGDQAFTYIAGALFNGTPGQLRYAEGVLSADLNGDTLPDVQITLEGVPSLRAGDFWL
ncbi:carbohydrate-binding domain-containing protein [Sediminicoccus sp. BL-A-41-H5]|uniref:carbohydrate-binding domain-containing protein n=1 Tax=Sediminicoccus sp. BL-A-41-H5 TaxID=3421106 RepID=UPI003D67489C